MYPEQYTYMLELKRALDANGSTGKTVCLLSLITSYQFAHPETGKLIYCTRTVPEMVKCMEEIQNVISYRAKVAGAESANILALCLSSRRNLCIHPRVIEEGDRDTVDSLCRNMTASWIRDKASREGNGSANDGVDDMEDVATESARGSTTQLCGFYESLEAEGNAADVPMGVYDLDRLKDLGRKRGWCPYFLARRMLGRANIIVYNYQYMLDPKVSNLVSRELEQESIVVFDEGHNIDNICIEALSVTLDKRSLDNSSRCIGRLQSKVAAMKASDSQRLANEYRALVTGLADQGLLTGSGADQILANPLIPEDILQEAVPGNIRKAEHFINFLKKVVEYLKRRLRGPDVEKETPVSFMHDLHVKTALDGKPLRFTYSRLNSLLRTLEIAALEEFNPLQDVANFSTLVATYSEGFSVVFEPQLLCSAAGQGTAIAGVQEPLLQLCCLDASLAMSPVFKRFKSVVITSGTLSPIDLYPKILNFHPVVRVSLPMSTFRPCLLPLVVTRGSDQTPLSTKFDQRRDVSIIRNYGALLRDMAANVPDGICCFFTSYSYMEYVITKWDEMRILQRVADHKLIFLETKDVVETTLALDNYKRACDCGRGAVFLSVARGKVAEGIDFDKHYGRCVILFGIPYQYTLSHVLRSRLDFMRANYQIKENDFLTFDALRQAAQCVGRVIRSKTDYGLVILADSRYNRYDKRSKFPPWINQFLKEDSCLNLSTDIAVEQAKQFLKEMGQPIDKDALRLILMDESQIMGRKRDRGHLIAASYSHSVEDNTNNDTCTGGDTDAIDIMEVVEE